MPGLQRLTPAAPSPAARANEILSEIKENTQVSAEKLVQLMGAWSKMDTREQATLAKKHDLSEKAMDHMSVTTGKIVELNQVADALNRQNAQQTPQPGQALPAADAPTPLSTQPKPKSQDKRYAVEIDADGNPVVMDRNNNKPVDANKLAQQQQDVQRSQTRVLDLLSRNTTTMTGTRPTVGANFDLRNVFDNPTVAITMLKRMNALTPGNMNQQYIIAGERSNANDRTIDSSVVQTKNFEAQEEVSYEGKQLIETNEFLNATKRQMNKQIDAGEERDLKQDNAEAFAAQQQANQQKGVAKPSNTGIADVAEPTSDYTTPSPLKTTPGARD